MDISKLNLFSLMQTNLSYLNERQNVLAQNIANANVPGYMEKDISAPDFSKAMGAAGGAGVTLAATQPGHISGTNNASFKVGNSKIKGSEITPTGNSVVIEDEVLKMSKNSLEYQQTTDLYKKMTDMVKVAVGSN